MARGHNEYYESSEFVKPQKRFWPLKIPISHWQLRHFISHSEPDHLYYASKPEVYCLNTVTKKRRLIAILPFDARCTASGYGWVCVGGAESGHFAAIKLDGSGDVDAPLPINAWRTDRRPPNVKVESIGEEIVNSISIHRIQDEEAHLDDIVAVVTNNDKTVRIYSLPQGVETKTIRLIHPMNHATISPDGTMLVAVGDHNEAHFFTRILKEQPPLIHKPHNRLTSASIDWQLLCCRSLYVAGADSPLGYFTTAWSPDGRYVALGSEGGYITIFDVATLQVDDGTDPVVAIIPSSRADCAMPYVGSVRTMIFSPAPWDLLIWSEDQGRVCIGDLRSGLAKVQVLTLEPSDQDVDMIHVQDTLTDGATQDEIEQLLQASQRDLESLEGDFLRRYRRTQGSAPTYASEYLEARSRQRQQRLNDVLRSSRNPHADDPRGLSADEQEILESLRTSRQREEARTAGRAQSINYTSLEALQTARSSNSSTPNTIDSSNRMFNAQDSFPALSRTFANASRPASAHDSNVNLPLPAHGDTHAWDRQGLFNGLTLPELSSTRRRGSTLNTPPGSSPSPPISMSALARQAQLSAPTTQSEAEEEPNPWRTIQDAMNITQGPLFEPHNRLQERSPLSQHLPIETQELAEIQALARRRNRLRNARISLSNVRNGPGISSSAEQAFNTDYEAFRRRMTGSGRELGVRTAGLAMSKDGRTLWAACEEGIFEFTVNCKQRMFVPSIVLR